jgi:CubicO group peptidase (beta-lactamase class C family)
MPIPRSITLLQSGLGLLLVALPIAAQRAAPSAGQIDALFAVSGDAPGCAVGVRHNGAVVHRAGYGLADLEHRVPITPTSVFYTGSISKQFTAASIWLAVNDQRVNLNANVRQYIPELPFVARDVTVRHLIHHTGGLREKWDLLSMQGVPVATTLITQQMVLDLVRRQRDVNFPAGTRYAYSNTGYDLLATVIERATGHPIRRFAHDRIFKPMGMTRTLYADRYGELIPDRVMGYAWRDGAWSLAPAMVETVGSGSVYSTVDDLLTWASVFELEPPAQVEGLRQMETPGALDDGTPLTYAWGLVVDQWKDMRRVQHGGALAGYRTAIWRLPEQKWAGVILCNSAEALPDAKMAQLAALWFGAPRPDVQTNTVTNVSITVPPPGEIPADIVGEYWSDELLTTWTIAKRDSVYVLRRGTVPEQRLNVGQQGEVRIGGFGLGGWRLDVVRDSAGRITELVVGAGRSSGVRFGRR